jgi:hypothetical protein
MADAAKRLASEGVLQSSFKVPDAVGPISVEANLQSSQVTTSVEIEAPRDVKTPRGSVGWLLRQLKDAPDDLRIDVKFSNIRETRSELLRDARDAKERLLLSGDSKRQPRAFVLARTQSMGRKAGRGDGSFANETRKQAMAFYRDLVQEIHAPRPEAPKIRKNGDEKGRANTRPNHEATEGKARRDHRSALKTVAALEDLVPTDSVEKAS